jgi:flagellar hook assembly protein FlgD
MASAISSLFGSSATPGATAAASGSNQATASGVQPPSEEMFLKLLVSQIQNQDPLNPADSTQFVSQLAQFSELEQVVAIRSDIETAMAGNGQQNSSNPAVSPSTPSPNLPVTPAASSNSTSTSNNLIQ